MFRIGTVTWWNVCVEGLWRMRRHGPVIVQCADSVAFPITFPGPDRNPGPGTRSHGSQWTFNELINTSIFWIRWTIVAGGWIAADEASAVFTHTVESAFNTATSRQHLCKNELYQKDSGPVSFHAVSAPQISAYGNYTYERRACIKISKYL